MNTDTSQNPSDNLLSGLFSSNVLPSMTSLDCVKQNTGTHTTFDISGATRANTQAINATQKSTKTGTNYLVFGGICLAVLLYMSYN